MEEHVFVRIPAAVLEDGMVSTVKHVSGIVLLFFRKLVPDIRSLLRTDARQLAACHAVIWDQYMYVRSCDIGKL